MAALEDDGQHRQPPPAIPPSPTLSNPDMILPLNEGERESQTPSPPFNLPSLSHLQAFYGSGGANASSLLPPDYTAEHYNNNNTNYYNYNNTNHSNYYMATGGAPIGVAYSLANSNSRAPPKKAFNKRHSAHRLSDIGEEEGPMPPPRSSSRTMGRFPVNAPAAGQDWRELASSSRAMENGNNNRVSDASGGSGSGTGTRSSSSSSTASGKTEVPVQQSQQQQQPQQQGEEGTSEQKGTVASGKGHGLHVGVNDMVRQGPGDELSSVILSSEAERILDNAKKRLTLMEGNLTRARSSMRSPSMSSTSPSPSPANQPLGVGLGQPVGGLYQTISRSDRQASAALRPRPMYSTYQDAAGNRHSRVLSETNLPSSGQTLPVPETNGFSRSVSAMGSSSSSNYFQRDDRSFRYDPTKSYLTHRSSTPSMQQRLSPVPNGYASRSKQSTPCDSSGLGIVEEGHNPTKISNMDDFNSVYPAQDPPSRTQSQLQVRDLQDQMKGLHIKISSLKVKAQEDGLRRRSLQSLRTPSPLNEADPWYINAMEYRDRRGQLSPNPAGIRLTPESARDPQTPKEPGLPMGEPVNGQVKPNEVEVPAAADTKLPEPEFQTPGQTTEDDGPAGESLYEDAEEGEEYDDVASNPEIDREALDEILREPLDDDLNDPNLELSQHDATPHEEREDAFDYEHFILHSALGNYSHSKLRRASNLSNSSVETTRPVNGRSARHSRANSATSLSTEATFATANEETDFNGVLYWDRKFNDELRGRPHYSSSDESNPENPREPATPNGTPKAIRRQPSARTNGPDTSSTISLEPPPLPRSESTTGSATPTALASSLVSTVRAASSSPYSSVGHENTGLNNDDERLLEQLFQSLGNVCMDLQTITTGQEPDVKSVRVLRRRLDAARRVLDGELDA